MVVWDTRDRNMNLVFCKFCVMDGTSEIILDKEGKCNFCHQAQKALKEIELEKPNLSKWIKKIKEDGRGKKYGAILGISGGADSSTTLHYAVKMGLRVYAITMDNGYNHPYADENILRMVESLKVPLYRYVLNINRYEKLRAAYLKAGVINIEATYDNLLAGAIYKVANEYRVNWILSGGNVISESVMPVNWSYRSSDLVNMKDIYYKMTGKKLRSDKDFPLFGTWKFNFYKWWKGIKVFYLLDYFDYNPKEARKMLAQFYGWKDYGNKHEENRFTKWYQSFYLFTKFNIDKRKAHYSSLINAGQMTRAEAMELLANQPIYERLNIDEVQVMKYKKHQHEDFKTDKLWKYLTTLIRVLRKPYRRLIRIGRAIKD